MNRPAAKALLERLFRAGVEAALPKTVLPEALASLNPPPTLLIAAGKGAVEMAEAALASGVKPRAGIVVTRKGQGRSVGDLEVLEAAHPTPDETSVEAARRVLDFAEKAGPHDHVLMLLSGGASALLCLPGEGLSLQAKQAVTKALLRSGAPVDKINVVRRHLSGIKGGRLAAAVHPAKLTTLTISDVVGDAPEAIGSGPTAPDLSTLDDARTALARCNVDDPGAGWSESIKPGDPRLEGAAYRIVASAKQSLAAVRKAAAEAGFEVVDLGDDLEGEARDLGARHAELARQHAEPHRRIALISGGELTVTVKGEGRGGRNLEYCAALALGLDGLDGVAALAGDSDGIDGASDAAGAFVFGDTAERARDVGHDLKAALAENDVHPAFEAIGDLYAPGPTGTNVNDLRIILISGDSAAPP